MSNNVVIAFKARPEKTMNGQGIIDWYTNNGYLGEFLEAYAVNSSGEMTYNKTSRLYEINFMPNDSWPKEHRKQVDEAEIYLGNPDDDGNYPIDGYVVECEIISVNGQKI